MDTLRCFGEGSWSFFHGLSDLRVGQICCVLSMFVLVQYSMEVLVQSIRGYEDLCIFYNRINLIDFR